MGILVRKKRLFEDGQPNGNQPQTNIPQQTTPNANGGGGNQPQTNNPQQTTPYDNSQSGGNQPQTNIPQETTPNDNGQHGNQPQTNQKQTPAAELNTKVQNCVNFLSQTVGKNDPFALMTLNIPDKIKEMVPEFKAENPKAKDAIGAWDKFKAQPSKETWDSFVNMFVAFGNSGLEEEKNKVNPQPATTPQATQAVQQTMQGESMNLNFSHMLNERIELKKNIRTICRSIEDTYLDD